MDVLSDVLSWLRVEGTVTRRSEFSAPWGIAYPPTETFAFIAVEKGSCFLLFEGHDPIAVETGDVVMVSPGQAGCLVDQPSTPTVPYARVREVCAVVEDEDEGEGGVLDRDGYPGIRYGGGGRQSVIRGWGLRFDSYEQHPLLTLLPAFIHITYEQRSALPWLETTLRFISHEARNMGDGSEMMIVRLVDLLFVQVLRAWFRQQPDGEAGWLGALRDNSIRYVLKLIHRSPAEPWTVESLGKAVGMSRSSFSARFRHLVGSSPLQYLTELRMNLAANAMKGDAQLSLAEVAHRVGYDSGSSFGRAFKRHFGMSPGAFRKQLRRGVAAEGQ